MDKRFQFKAFDKNGELKAGELIACSKSSAKAKIAAQYDSIVSVSAIRGYRSHLKQKIKTQDLITFTQNLNQLLLSGIQLTHALETLSHQRALAKIHKVIISLQKQINTGNSFSKACLSHPEIFNAVWCGMIEIGEKTGKLSTVISHLESLLLWQYALKKRMQKLLVYPILLLLIILVVFIALMIWVVPELAIFLHSLNSELNAATQMLLLSSELIRTQGWWLLIGLAFMSTMLFVLKFYLKSVGANLERFKETLPVFGELLLIYQRTILSRQFAIMTSANINFIEALSLIQRMQPNLQKNEKFKAILQQITSGKEPFQAVKQHKLFCPIGESFIETGFKTAKVDNAFQSCSDYYWLLLNQKIERIEPLIQPVMTAFLGMIVLWLVVAVLVPIYDLVSHIQ